MRNATLLVVGALSRERIISKLVHSTSSATAAHMEGQEHISLDFTSVRQFSTCLAVDAYSSHVSTFVPESVSKMATWDPTYAVRFENAHVKLALVQR